MKNLLSDAQYTLRQWRKTPGFALTAILTLALGLGANTAIFTLLDQALLRSLPVQDPKSLVVLEGTGKSWDGRTSTHGGDTEAYFSYPMYRDLRDQNKAFDGLIATLQTQVGVEWNHHSELVHAALVSGNYFQVLGVTPALGRVLTQNDDLVKNGAPVAVLSFAYWQTHLGSNPSILNQTININGNPFQVVGVSKPGFSSAIWGSPADLFVPMTMKPQITPGWDDLDSHTSRWLNIIGRLKSGESRQQAATAMAPLWHSLRAEELKQLGHKSQHFVNGYLTNSKLLVLDGANGFSYSRGFMRTPLLVQMGMVFLVLLMAAVNVASLILVRTAGRMREFSMRYSLGANRRRIVMQLFIEGLMLGIAGGTCALFLAPLATRVLVNHIVSDGDTIFSTNLDPRIVLFNFGIAIVISLLFTLAPVAQLWKPDLVETVKRQSAASAGGALGFRRLTVGLQIGLSMLLLLASSLFARTLANLHSVDVGFAIDHLMTFDLDPTRAGYTADQITPLHKRILADLSTIPGVSAVAASDDPELAGDHNGGNISVEGYTAQPDENINVEMPSVSFNYFSTMKIPLLAGRSFTEQDDGGHPKVAIVNASLAKRFYGTPSKALGRRIGFGAGNKTKFDIEIVGVVGDTVHGSMDDPIKMTLFSPVLQSKNVTGLAYYVRTWSAPSTTEASIRQTMNHLDSKLIVDSLHTMQAQIDQNLRAQQTIALLAISFGVLASFLAAIGIYGVLAYSTAQRTREIGIRMALGSDRLSVVLMVLRELALLAGISIVVTIPIAMGLTRTIKSQLYNVSTSDPLIYSTVVLSVGLVALIAAVLPARRAASVNPSEALRSE